MEFSICESLGIPYSEFIKLPDWERTGWKMFHLVKGKRAAMWQQAAEAKALAQANAPKVRSR
jgi:hypothetical protein